MCSKYSVRNVSLLQLPWEKVCDGVVDCLDGSEADENATYCDTPCPRHWGHPPRNFAIT